MTSIERSLQIAREAWEAGQPTGWDEWARVIEQAIAEEREACAKIAEAVESGWTGPGACDEVARQIRERGKQP